MKNPLDDLDLEQLHKDKSFILLLIKQRTSLTDISELQQIVSNIDKLIELKTFK